MDISSKIKEIIKTKNYNSLEYIAQSINILLLRKNIEDRIKYIENLELTDYERIIFLLKMEESKKLAPSIKFESIKYSINNFINNNSNFLELLKNSDILNDFIIWFKKNINYNKIELNILEQILKSSEFQSKFLLDIESWNNKRPFELFNSLPKKLGYLIAFYYEFDIKIFSENLEKLYNKYFCDIISKKDRMNLLKEQIKINRKKDIFQKYNNYKMIYFLDFLKELSLNKNYYNIIINIVNKSGLTFDEILSFVYKYKNTILFKKMFNDEINYTTNLINKIKYLLMENRIKNENIDIENISIDELIKEEKEISNVKISLLGGPHSTSDNKMFKDGYKSEVRRIDIDGTIRICDASMQNHESAIKELYYDIKFKKEYSSVYEKALEALKKISSITLIIENNTCLILLNSKISKEQKEALNTIMNDNNINGDNLFGITIYNKDNDINSFAYDGNTVILEDTINFINSLEIKEKAITR